mgnify:CR=1 FL=1
MRIALDAMGGDYAPGPNILGALEAVELNPGLEVLLVGDRARLEEPEIHLLRGVLTTMQFRLKGGKE